MKYRAQRFPTNFAVQANLNGRIVNCLLEDVNQQGGRLSGVQGIEKDDKLSFNCAFGSATGIVRWTMNDQCGVQFTPPISLQLMQSFRHNGAAMTNVRFNSHSLREL